jgi:hypothetical protein
MAQKPSKHERKALLRELKQRQRAEAEGRIPLSTAGLGALFDFLNERLEDLPCDHTLVLTREFLAEREIPEDQILPWLAEYGGHCDCEVLANVESEWGEYLE